MKHFKASVLAIDMKNDELFLCQVTNGDCLLFPKSRLLSMAKLPLSLFLPSFSFFYSLFLPLSFEFLPHFQDLWFHSPPPVRCPRICPFWSILTLVRESMWDRYKRRVVLERLLWDGCGGHSEPKTAKKRVFLPYWRQKIGFKFFPSYIWCKMGLFYDPWSLKKIGPKESPKMA